MTTPTPEAIEAGVASGMDTHDWELLKSQGDIGEAVELAIRDALSVASPFIAAQAKAEAWDAVIARIDLGTPHMVDEKYVAGANWVRNQIEDVLKPTIEGKSE